MSVWRAALHDRFRGRPRPLLVHADGVVSAATVGAAARRWVAWLRDAGVGPGDRVICALPPGPGFVALLVAALREELTLAPVPPSADLDAVADEVDARLVVAPDDRGGVRVAPEGTPGSPVPASTRRSRTPPTPAARLLLQTSGTTGARRWIALSDANLAAVLDSHRPHLALAGARVLSVLPWHHAFGLVIELLPALLAGAEVVRDPAGGRDPRALLALAAAHPVTHCSLVPHTVGRLLDAPGGAAWLEGLRGGVVGGAAVDAPLAARLARTRLRVGYGQTEASPGIALGAPGEWRAGWLGRPVGCATRVDADGVLAFRGPNACLGEWRDGELMLLPPDRWVRTGDLVRAEDDGGYTFEGRLADSFKLANGRHVAAAAIEAVVRARFGGLREALLSSPDGEGLLLACTAGDAPLPAPDDVAPLLGALAGRPLRVVAVPAHAWARTPKGELDRRFPTGRSAA